MSESKDNYIPNEKVNSSDLNQISQNANDGGGFRDTLDMGEAFTGATTPQPAYIDTSDNKLYQCDGDDLDKIKFAGFVLNTGIANDDAELQSEGIVRGFTGLNEGEYYYLSDTKGAINNTDIKNKLIGIAITSTELLILKDRLEQDTINYLIKTNKFYKYQSIPSYDGANGLWSISNLDGLFAGYFYGGTLADMTAGHKTLGVGTVSNIASYKFDASKKIVIKFKARVTNDAINTYGGFGLTKALSYFHDDSYTAINEKVGFHINYNASSVDLYAVNGDGSGNTNTDVSSGITIQDWNDYMIVYDPVTPEAKFYINGDLVATHTTNLPNADTSDVYIGCGQKSGRRMALSQFNIYLEN